MRRNAYFLLCTTVVLACLTDTQAFAGLYEEGVFLDSQSGDYIIRYRSTYPGHALVETRFVPATKISPVVKSRLTASTDGVVTYHYQVRSERTGKQDIALLIVTATHAFESGQVTPSGWWDGAVRPNIGGTGYLVSWSYLSGNASRANASERGLVPGGSAGFGFRSNDLPGVGQIKVAGNAPVPAYPDEGPDPESPVGRQVNEMEANDFVFHHAAAPRIPNPAPFDAATVLTGVQKHIKDDLVGMKLVEPAFADKLDQGLTSAIEAAKGGNTEALRGELKKLRHLVKGFGEPEDDNHAAARKDKEGDQDSPEDRIRTKDWPHPIAKLAARVLDFDLKYVEKRVKGTLD